MSDGELCIPLGNIFTNLDELFAVMARDDNVFDLSNNKMKLFPAFNNEMLSPEDLREIKSTSNDLRKLIRDFDRGKNYSMWLD